MKYLYFFSVFAPFDNTRHLNEWEDNTGMNGWTDWVFTDLHAFMWESIFKLKSILSFLSPLNSRY